MRQLESTERQIRSRAAAWTELETKLRAELEEAIIENEKLKKECYEADITSKRSQRAISEWENKCKESQERNIKTSKLLDECNDSYQNALKELESMKEEQLHFTENTKNEEARAKNEMVKKIKDIENQYRDQLDAVETELRREREERISVETKLLALVTSASLEPLSSKAGEMTGTTKKSRQLGDKVDQVDILQDTLLGLDDDGSEEEIHEQDSRVEDTFGGKEKGSFAFMEQLSQALKVSKIEREALRKQLQESEERRSEVENDSVRGREASAILPKLEAELEETKRVLKEKCQEIQGLREDISEVRQMYRVQLNDLLEEKVNDLKGKTVNETKQQEKSLPATDKANLDDGGNAVSMTESFAMERF